MIFDWDATLRCEKIITNFFPLFVFCLTRTPHLAHGLTFLAARRVIFTFFSSCNYSPSPM